MLSTCTPAPSRRRKTGVAAPIDYQPRAHKSQTCTDANQELHVCCWHWR